MRGMLALVGAGQALLGASVVAGRAGGWPALVHWGASAPFMTAPTAAGFVVAGLAFLAAAFGWRKATRGLAGLMILGGGGLLAYYVLAPLAGLSGYSYAPEDAVRLTGLTGRMSPNSAFAFALLGVCLLLMRAERPAARLTVLLSSVVLVPSLIALYGHVTGLRATMSGWRYVGMVLPTAIAFTATGLVTLLWALRQLPEEQRDRLRSAPLLFAAGAFVVMSGLTAYSSNRRQEESARWVAHTYEVIASANYIELLVTRMESEARAFALSREESFAGRFDDMARRLRAEHNQLRFLSESDPEEQARVAELERLTAAKADHLRRLMAEMRGADGPIRPETQRAPEGPALMAAIRNLVNDLEQNERRLLAQRAADTERLAEQTGRIILFGHAAALALSGAALLTIRRAERARTAARVALEQANATLERRVEERSRSLRFLADAVPELVWTRYEENGIRIEAFNRRWIEYTGLAEEQLRQRGWLAALHPDDAALTLASWQDVQDRVVEGAGEYRLRRGADGAYRWFLWRARPERDAAGGITRWVASSTDIHEQKTLRDQLEERVRQRTAELDAVLRLQRAVLDGTVFSVIATRPDGLITEFNTGAERMLGYRRDEMVGRRSPAVLHDAAEVAARAAELSQQLGRPVTPDFETLVARPREGFVEEREWTYIRKDGTRLPVWLSVTALYDAQGTVNGFLGIAQDLTERKQAEQELANSRRRLLEAQRIARFGNWEFVVGARDDEWWSDELFGIFGYAPGEALADSDSFYRIVHPEDRARVRAAVDAALATGTGFTLEYRIIRRDGVQRHVRDEAQLTREPDGSMRLRGVVQDVTAQKEAERALRESEERFRNAFDFAGTGMSIATLDGGMLRVNRALCEIVGYSETELLAMTYQQLTHPDDRSRDAEGAAAMQAGRLRFYQVEKRYLHRQGHLVWVRVTVSLIRDGAGGPAHYVTQIEDISERKQLLDNLAEARDQALAASRLKSEFLANMSHEIRTPMNGIIGMTGLLLDSPLNEAQREMAQVVQSSSEVLLRIINDILDFSKIEAGQMRIEAEDFDLRQVVEEIKGLLSPLARARNLALDVTVAADLPAALHGDAGRLRQVLLNLVGNALKFTDQGGVRVSAARVEGVAGRPRLQVEVVDTGIGITPEQGKKLFQPFVQADGTTTRRYGGTGLGLAISRQLVELMGGRIGFESQPGAGSRFWIELELTAAADPVVAHAGAVAGAGAGPTGRRILVAEDNVANQLVIRRLLDRLGHICVIVPDGGAAIEALARERFDAVLMDCQMPGVDGYTATRRIRAGEAAGVDPKVIIIALTAYAMPSDRQTCLVAGMDDYVAKPVRLESLREALQRWGISADNAPPPAVMPALPSAPAVTPEDMLDPAQVAMLRELPGRKSASLLAELIGIFLRETPGLLAEIEALAAAQQAERLALLAHRLAGSAGNLGAGTLRAEGLALEETVKRGDWPRVTERVAAVRREWDRLRPGLEATISA